MYDGRKEADMKLYHTGNIEIRCPDILHGRKNADFGQGFYLTPDREFTYRWAGRESIVNEYELDEKDLVIYRFHRDEEWFNYIFRNRRVQDTLSADVVIGPIANDTIFDTLGIISSGLLSPSDALKLLMIGPEYIQVAVKTDRAVKNLRWTGAEKITKQDETLQKAEQDKYQAAFAALMQEIL